MRITSPQLDDVLAREILLGQRMRATILAGVFGISVAMLSVLAVVERLGSGDAVLPVIVPPMVAVLALQQLGLRAYITRRIRSGQRVPEAFWYFNAFVEISTITAVIVGIAPALGNPVHALLTPTMLGYALFIILSTLRLDFRTSLFTGALAAAQVSALSLYYLGNASAVSGFDPLFSTPYPYLMKSFLLLAGGFGAGLVGRELRMRIQRSVIAVTEREQMERADVAKTAFLANMSHEIRTPLNAILGYAQLLEKEHSPSDRQHYLATIRRSGDHLLGVINQVLDLSRIEAGEDDVALAAFDLGALVREMGAMFELRCGQRGLGWHVEVHASPVRVQGDERRIRQVLINLLGNAVRFTQHGSVSLRVTGAGTYTFEVIDTGPGIPAERQAAVFEPFRQEAAGLSAGGSGLGLAIASAQVRQMGGTLELESAPGAGSRFRFALVLPAADTAPAQARVPEVVRLAPGCRVSALVVDDVAENRDVLGLCLSRIGVEVRHATSGAEARALVRAHAPDIVFLDVRMPGLSGPETLARLDADGLRGGIRVVAVSASALDHERQACLRAGFDDFIVKPIQLARVYACMAELLGVTYTHEAGSYVVSGDDGGFDAAGVIIPDELLRALRTAVAEFNVTALRKSLDALDALGSDVQPFAAHVRDLSRRYDMDGIAAALDNLGHTTHA